MKDAECPYCGAAVEICHDDGQGYAEDVMHRQTCGNCEKEFVFYTSISFSYDTRKADCLNGGDHKWKKTITLPPKFARMQCTECGEEKPLTENPESTGREA